MTTDPAGIPLDTARTPLRGGIGGHQVSWFGDRQVYAIRSVHCCSVGVARVSATHAARCWRSRTRRRRRARIRLLASRTSSDLSGCRRPRRMGGVWSSTPPAYRPPPPAEETCAVTRAEGRPSPSPSGRPFTAATGPGGPPRVRRRHAVQYEDRSRWSRRSTAFTAHLHVPPRTRLSVHSRPTAAGTSGRRPTAGTTTP